MIYHFKKIFILPVFLLLLFSCNSDQQDKITQENKIEEKLYPIQVDGKYGFIDKTGKVAIEPKFEYVGTFSEGLYAVLINGKWGFIDRKEKIVIEPKYDNPSEFKNGLALVNERENEFYINKKGTYVLGKTEEIKDKNKDAHKSKFEDIGEFKEGLAKARKNG
ncbi:MAG: WG repeat-containing protein, partial [Thermodesulfobacteriota bacterium]